MLYNVVSKIKHHIIYRKFLKKSFKMKFSDKGIMTVAGTIRGAIAFGLAVSLSIDNEYHKSILISSTLGLVMLTTLVFGAIMPFAIKFLKSFDEIDSNQTIGLIEVLKDKELNELKSSENHMSNVKKIGKVFEFMHPNFNEQ